MGDTEQLNQDTAEVGLTDQSVADTGENSDGGAAQEPVYEIDGEQVKASDIKTWKTGHMLQSDYTRKTQELARERQTLQPVSELANYLRTNPEAAQKVYNTLYGNGQEVDPVQLKLNQQEQMLQSLLQENSLNKVNSMVRDIQSDAKYEGLFKNPTMEQSLLATALQAGKTRLEDLKEVADGMHQEILKLRVESQKAGEQKVIKNLGSPTRKGETSKGTVAPPADFDASKSGWRDIGKKALNYL